MEGSKYISLMKSKSSTLRLIPNPHTFVEIEINTHREHIYGGALSAAALRPVSLIISSFENLTEANCILSLFSHQ